VIILGNQLMIVRRSKLNLGRKPTKKVLLLAFEFGNLYINLLDRLDFVIFYITQDFLPKSFI
jgi:hypothetical protein